MNTKPPEKPGLIKLIGWTYFALAIITFFSSILGYVSFAYLHAGLEGELLMPEDTLPQFKIFWNMLPYYDKITLGQIILSAFVLVASIDFLRLRSWARTALELVSWWIVFLHIGFGIIWVYMWLSMPFGITRESGQVMQLLIRLGGSLLGLIVILVFTIPFFVVIRYLRKDGIKKFFLNT
jgi:hypothetical protein